MTETDERLRELLHELADEARPAPFLVRLDHRGISVRRRRWFAAVATVAAAALAVVVVNTHSQHTAEPLPTDRPPKVFRLADKTSARPGLAWMAVTLPGGGEKPVYLQRAKGGPAVRLRPPDVSSGVWSQQLSADGTRLIRQNNGQSPRVEVVNLLTGRSDTLGGPDSTCPQLSPNNRTVAAWGLHDDVELIDVRSGTRTVIRPPPPTTPMVRSGATGNCIGLAWSPDSRTLWVRTPAGSALIDRRGRVLVRVPGAHVPNGSMSWSPDGRSTLMYRVRQGQFMIVPTDGGPPTLLRRPPDGVQPLGWAGPRVVWLVGQAGAQSLVTTDRRGEGARTWMRFDVGDQVVEAVSWSRALSG